MRQVICLIPMMVVTLILMAVGGSYKAAHENGYDLTKPSLRQVGRKRSRSETNECNATRENSTVRRSQTSRSNLVVDRIRPSRNAERNATCEPSSGGEAAVVSVLSLSRFSALFSPHGTPDHSHPVVFFSLLLFCFVLFSLLIVLLRHVGARDLHRRGLVEPARG